MFISPVIGDLLFDGYKKGASQREALFLKYNAPSIISTFAHLLANRKYITYVNTKN